MRSQMINKKSFKYSLYLGDTEVIDEYGLPTGDFEPSYAPAITFKANISANTGKSGYNFFGIANNYSHIITTTDMSCPITESSIIEFEGNKYVVVKKATSLNSILYAISEV